MKSYTVEITDAQDKALKTEIKDITAWLANAIKVKANKLIDKIVKELETEKTDEEKATVILNATLKTVAEINAEQKDA